MLGSELSDHKVSLFLSDHYDAPAPWKCTAGFLYIGAHGPGGRYKGHYTAAVLRQWAKRIESWQKQGCDIYVYFDNDQKSAAPADALRLRAFLDRPRYRSRIDLASPGLFWEQHLLKVVCDPGPRAPVVMRSRMTAAWRRTRGMPIATPLRRSRRKPQFCSAFRPFSSLRPVSDRAAQ